MDGLTKTTELNVSGTATYNDINATGDFHAGGIISCGNTLFLDGNTFGNGNIIYGTDGMIKLIGGSPGEPVMSPLRVGINELSPDATLDVNGNVRINTIPDNPGAGYVLVTGSDKIIGKKEIQDLGPWEPAANGIVYNGGPLMRSGLVLAGANDVWNKNGESDGEDGVLTAQEVAHIDMRATVLVVLSACETGLGDIKGSEGVYGLQRAFKMAGADYLVMSLWKVADKETEEFMVAFYSELMKQKDVRKAFNTAQLEMRRKYDPYYWGAFVLIE